MCAVCFHSKIVADVIACVCVCFVSNYSVSSISILQCPIINKPTNIQISIFPIQIRHKYIMWKWTLSLWPLSFESCIAVVFSLVLCSKRYVICITKDFATHVETSQKFYEWNLCFESKTSTFVPHNLASVLFILSDPIAFNFWKFSFTSFVQLLVAIFACMHKVGAMLMHIIHFSLGLQNFPIKSTCIRFS